MDRIIPLISSGTAGPLGAVHLPRLWSKLLTGCADRLAEGYDFCGSGFDQMTLDGLGLDKDKTIEFVRSTHPTYVQFERWVVQNGTKVDPASIEKHNAAVRSYNHPDDKAAHMREDMGVKDASIKDAVTLNTLDDFATLHEEVVSHLATT